MGYCLAKSVTFCLPAAKPIFLDVKRNRYYRLGTKAEAAFLALLNGSMPSVSDLERLLRLGLIDDCDDAEQALVPTFHPIPDYSLVESQQVKGIRNARIFSEVAFILAKISIRLKLGRFEQAINRVRNRKCQVAFTKPPETDSAISLTCQFNDARRWIPIKPACLLDSLALLEFLARRQAYPDLVIGVCPEPFGAHSWVQTDQLILNDSVGNVAAHSPILVI